MEGEDAININDFFLNFKRAIIWDSQEVSHVEGVESGGCGGGEVEQV